MRIIIKDADFSANSIGKVGKDLSFAFNTVDELRNMPWLNIVDKTEALPWNEDMGNTSTITFYAATTSATTFSTITNAARIISDYFEVVEGMQISVLTNNTINIPTLLCFDENKNILGPSSTYTEWLGTTGSFIFTVPSGVKYIQFQINTLDTGHYFRGTMPE